MVSERMDDVDYVEMCLRGACRRSQVKRTLTRLATWKECYYQVASRRDDAEDRMADLVRRMDRIAGQWGKWAEREEMAEEYMLLKRNCLQYGRDAAHYRWMVLRLDPKWIPMHRSCENRLHLFLCRTMGPAAHGDGRYMTFN